MVFRSLRSQWFKPLLLLCLLRSPLSAWGEDISKKNIKQIPQVEAPAAIRTSLENPEAVRPKVLRFNEAISPSAPEAPQPANTKEAEFSRSANSRDPDIAPVDRSVERRSVENSSFLSTLQIAVSQRVEALRQNLFLLSRVNINGAYRVDREELLSYLGLTPAASIFSAVIPHLSARLTQHPWVEKYKIDHQLYPLALEITIEEREPWLIAEYERHSWLISTAGHLIQPLDSLKNKELIFETTELPRLDGLDPLVGKDSLLNSANARFHYAMKQLRFLQASTLPFSVERYTLLPNGELRLLPSERNGLEIILLCQDYDEAKLLTARLQSVLSDLDSRGERPRRIDLRFKNQVVVE